MTTADAAHATDPLFAAHWDDAVSWDAYLESVEAKRDLWLSYTKRASVGDAERARLDALPGARRVLVLTEDWCGDAIRSIPGLAAALEQTDGIDVRFLSIDDHPDAMDGLRTHGGKAIPIVVVADEKGARLGVWGPRPAPLQALLRARRLELGAPTAETMAEFYAPIMAWYGKDGGVTALQELLMILERGGEPR